MAKLADVDEHIRTFGKIAAVAVVALGLLFVVIVSGQFIKNILFPTPVAPPAQKFGALPPVTFPGQKSQDLTYNINTLTGSLPGFSDRLNVYTIKTSESNLVALANARELVASAGFDQAETKISNTVYQWSDNSGLAIQYDINTKNFKVSRDFLSISLENSSAYSAGKEGLYSIALDFLQSLGADISNFDEGKSKITYLSVVDGKVVNAQSRDDATLLRLDIFLADLGRLPIYYPGFSQSPLYFLYRIDGFGAKIVEGSYYNFKTDKSSDYPIKTSTQAYKDLTDGNAYINNEGNSENVDITDVSLGYYVAPNQNYYLPIYVFTGKGFTAYVNALFPQ